MNVMSNIVELKIKVLMSSCKAHCVCHRLAIYLNHSLREAEVNC